MRKSLGLFIFLYVIFFGTAIFAYKPIINKLTLENIADLETRFNEKPNGHQAVLDYNGKYELQWDYDNDTITFAVTVQAQGWVGLGFTPSHGMTSADIVFIWIDPNGHGQISDTHATSNGYPEKDHQQDYTLINASKNTTHIIASFHRRRNTCDEKDYALNTKDSTRIIWAYSDRVPLDEDHFDKHEPAERGIKRVFLLEPAITSIQLPSDTITLDLLSDNTPLPTDYHLMYWCQIFQMPTWHKHHLIRLEEIIEKGNEPYVHHVALYHCVNNMSAYLEKGRKCFEGEGFNVSPVYQCVSKPIWFWNRGMQPTDLPNHVGLPMFESGTGVYFLLEMHYENLELKPGLTDNSGLRMYVTRTLRPVEAGVMYLGTPEEAPKQIIPPGESDFHFFVHSEKCLSYLPDTGVKLIYSLLHAHLYGKSISMHHYRNGAKLPDLAVDEKYDFTSQTFRLLSPPRLVLPGDQLVLDCLYNTTGTNDTIYGGYSTLDEMCLGLHYYYPRVARQLSCHSFPDPAVYVPMFGGQLVDKETVLLANKESVTLYEFVTNHVKWTKPGIRAQYKELVSNGQYIQILYYQPLKNDTNSNPPTETRVFTRKGYPKVDRAWIAEKENIQCGKPAKKKSIEN